MFQANPWRIHRSFSFYLKFECNETFKIKHGELGSYSRGGVINVYSLPFFFFVFLQGKRQETSTCHSSEWRGENLQRQFLSARESRKGKRSGRHCRDELTAAPHSARKRGKKSLGKDPEGLFSLFFALKPKGGSFFAAAGGPLVSSSLIELLFSFLVKF